MMKWKQASGWREIAAPLVLPTSAQVSFILAPRSIAELVALLPFYVSWIKIEFSCFLLMTQWCLSSVKEHRTHDGIEFMNFIATAS